MAEMLLSFTLFCLLAGFVPLFFPILLDQKHVNDQIQQMEWELFLRQFKKEVHGCDEAKVEYQRLVLMINGDRVSFQKYGDRLRRQVNYTGHEIVLQNIQLRSVDFEVTERKVKIKAVDMHEKTYEAEVFLFIGKNTTH